MSSEHLHTSAIPHHGIDHNASAPPVAIPAGHVGEFVFPETGRRVWWTGRVAIGLLHDTERRVDSTSQSALWIQQLMLGKPIRGAALHA